VKYKVDNSLLIINTKSSAKKKDNRNSWVICFPSRKGAEQCVQRKLCLKSIFSDPFDA